MRSDSLRPGSMMAALSVLLLSVEVVVAQQPSSTQVALHDANPAAAVAQAEPAILPESPGSLRYQIVAANQQTSAAPTSSQTSTPNSKPVEQPPVGTAAAEGIISGGTAASAPAGAAIAPAKQRQVRSILIRMGAVLGAGAAVGTVYALSTASPSKPPGAR